MEPHNRRREAVIQTTGCSFSAYGRKDGLVWILKVTKSSHNHPAAPPETFPGHRKRTAEDIKQVRLDRQRNLTALQIAVSLRTDNPTRFYKKQDIYNTIRDIRRDELGPLTPLQALLQELQGSEKWYVAYQLDPWDQLQSLFFAYQPALKWLVKYPDILFIDATYKTNKYNMPLVILTSTTACNKTFYVGFAFLLHEDREYYDWLVSHIKIVWVDVGCSDGPKTAVTDKDDALIGALEDGLPLTKLLLCQWHINKNVLARVKTGAYFSDAATQQAWTQLFFAVRNAPTVEGFDEALANLALADPDSGVNSRWSTTLYEYLLKEWFIEGTREKHCRAWTDTYTHFNKLVTSTAEGGHWGIKQGLESSLGDLATVVKQVQYKLEHQLHELHLSHESQKAGTMLLRHNAPIF